jgi:hypothetical protein
MNAVFNTAPDGSMFVRSLLHIDIRDIKFTDLPDSTKKADIEILVVAFGDNGTIVDQSGNTYTLTFTERQYQRLLQEGIVHTFTFPVKKAGAFQMRVAIRDTATDKVGSANQFVEVPNIKKDQLVLSGVVLENVSVEEYQRRSKAAADPGGSTALSDTSTRQFMNGTVLNYGYSAFNVKPGSLAAGGVETQIRIFRDGKAIYNGTPQKVTGASTRGRALDLIGSLMLGDAMTPGDYVLQIIVTDAMAKAKHNSASAFVSFEIVK